MRNEEDKDLYNYPNVAVWSMLDNQEKQFKEQIEKLTEENKKLRGGLEKYEGVIQDSYESCLCTRNTPGFDYHESHSKKGNPKSGARWLTPCDLIEQRIGFEWKYERPEGVCRSWKELSFLSKKLNKQEAEKC